MIIQERGERQGIHFLINYDTEDDDGIVDAIQEERNCGLISWAEAGYCLELVHRARVRYRKLLRKATESGHESSL